MYSDPPWVFKGRALYQLQLVKAEEAKKCIPEGLKLVEAFGHTLGGFYLARYDSSPVGSFDELVALTGLVWNPPTSCAWAARVYVNNKEARNHGLQSVGLPSRLAEFKEVPAAEVDQKGRLRERKKKHGLGLGNWWRQGKEAGAKTGNSKGQASSDDASYLQGFPDVQVWNAERAQGRSLSRVPVCTFASLPPAMRVHGDGLGPRIRLFLPSFSGGTLEHPGLLKYSCDLRTNIRLLPPARVLLPHCGDGGGGDSSRSRADNASNHSRRRRSSRSGSGSEGDSSNNSRGIPQREQSGSSRGRCLPGERGELMHTVLGGKPLLTMAFDDMELFGKQEEVLARGEGRALAYSAWGKPMLTMAFDDMEMYVEAPLKLELPSSTPSKTATVAASSRTKSYR